MLRSIRLIPCRTLWYASYVMDFLQVRHGSPAMLRYTQLGHSLRDALNGALSLISCKNADEKKLATAPGSAITSIPIFLFPSYESRSKKYGGLDVTVMWLIWPVGFNPSLRIAFLVFLKCSYRDSFEDFLNICSCRGNAFRRLFLHVRLKRSCVSKLSFFLFPMCSSFLHIDA